MTTLVSFTDFRENLSKYLSFIAEGNKVEISDTKKNKKIITLVAEKEEKFDWDEYMKFFKSVGGKLFTDKDVEDVERAREATNKRLRDFDW